MATSDVLDDHPLNTSDHLLVRAVTVMIPTQTRNGAPDNPTVDWDKVVKDQVRIDEYQFRAVDGLIRPSIGNIITMTVLHRLSKS